MFFDNFRKWLKQSIQTVRKGQRPKGRTLVRSYRPLLETLEDRVTPTVFTNSTAITLTNPPSIPAAPTAATAYPSTIVVSGATGTITDVNLILHNVTEAQASDLDILLVGPQGQKFKVVSDAGGNTVAVSNVTITFDSQSANLLEDSGGVNGWGAPGASTNSRPVDWSIQTDTFPAPAPASPYQTPEGDTSGTATFDSVFDGADPNGTWSLFIVDDNVGGSNGTIAGGWSLDITSVAAAATSTTLVSSVNPTFTASPTHQTTLTATVTSGGNPVTTGTVDFKDGSTVFQAGVALDGSGQAILSNHVFATEGSHQLTVVYNGTASFATSTSNTVSQEVNNHTTVSGNNYSNDISALTIVANNGANAGLATPYPSKIFVSGASGTISDLNVVLHNVSFSQASDLDILLVGPLGQKFVLVSDAGGNTVAITNVTVTFDDSAATLFEDSGGVNGWGAPNATVSALPVNRTNTSDTWPAPAPASGYQFPQGDGGGTATLASVFNGSDPNGTWSLYVLDDTIGGGANGAFAGGWSLNFTLVVAASTTTTVASNNNPSFTVAPNNSVTFTANVSSGSTVNEGTVTFKDNGVALPGSSTVNVVSGQAQFVTNFTAEGNHPITAVYNGTVNFATSTGSVTQEVNNHTTVSGNMFSNDLSALTINDNNGSNLGEATPYPSKIFVTGTSGTITDLNVTLHNVTDPTASAIDILLVGPGGQKFVLVSDAGGNAAAITNVTVTFDDSAATLFGDSAASTGWGAPNATVSALPVNRTDTADTWPLVTGPYQFPQGDGGGTATLASVFNGAAANGAWSLYVLDDSLGGGGGAIAGGWTLAFTLTVPPSVTTQPTNQTVDEDQNASFTAHATIGTPTPTVRWQQDTGSGFADLANVAPYSGVTTDTLLITGAPYSLNGSQYRAIYTNGSGTDTTNPVTLTVNPIADTPSVTNSTTSEDVQSTTGLVISRNAADGAEVTHFKITNITNGLLFQNDGTTQITNGAFITFAQGNAGLKFTPASNLYSPGTTFRFDVQGAIDAMGTGLSSAAAATITVNAVADTPGVTNASTVENTQTTSGLVISRNAADSTEVTHFKITNITNGTLFQNDGATPINAGDFITFAQANAGLKFTPTTSFLGNATFDVQASTSNTNGGLGGSTATATISVTPNVHTPSVTNATTNEDVQTTSGLVISRNAVDGAEVTHFKITNIQNGTLFQNDGTTQINSGDFITFAQGNAGLKFTPSPNSFAAGSFDVQSAIGATNTDVGGGTATATITVNAVADTPSVTNTSTNEDVQTTSGLVISRNAADGAEVTHFKITNILGGTLFQNNGTTQINAGDFITVAQGNAGLKFTPTADAFSPGTTFSFDVQASLSNTNAGLAADRIVFTSDRDGNLEIYGMNANGSGQTRLTTNSAIDDFPTLSPDGTKIAFRSQRDGNNEIYVMNFDGTNVIRLTTTSPLADEFKPAWSPDGTKIAFASNRDGNDEVYVMNADGSGQTRITNTASTVHDLDPSWSPDGTKIVFSSNPGGDFSTFYEIFVMNANGTGQTALTSNAAEDSYPSFSPDGSKIVFRSDRDGNPEIYVMNADGTGQTRLTTNAAFDGEPTWSPDGSKIVFRSNRDGNDEIHEMNSDGTGVTRVTNNMASDVEPSWGRGGVQAATITVNTVADTPSVTNTSTNEDVQTTTGLVIDRNAVDSTEVTHFKITNIQNGTLFQNDGTTQIVAGTFITVSQGNAGLKFTPSPNFFGNGAFDIQASTSNVNAGLGGSVITATITVNAVADTPSVTNTATNEDTQSTNGLVISRNAADSAEVTHFKITNIQNGTLFLNNGTTQINAGDFITVAQGNAGLKFTPTADLFSPGTTFSFDVQASIGNANAGLGGNTATATITVNTVADTPSVTNASTNEDVQTTTGLVISRNAVDGAEVTHFKITNIQNGTLFQNDGTTQIVAGTFITFAQGNAGLKFTPSPNFFGNGAFDIQASTSNVNAGLGGSVITATITVIAVADTPSVTNTATNEDTQSTNGLVISRNAADGSEVTHFKITNIQNGTLFLNNGTTPINAGDFITVPQGNAGLKFTPTANLFSPGTTFSFDVQASIGNANAGLGGNSATATITVNPVADTPSVTNTTTNLNTQSNSGLVISRNAVDSTEVTHFKITNIQNGTLFQNDGTTPINSGDFITFAQGNAGLKFTPGNNLFTPTTTFGFDVQASTSNSNGGLGGSVVTAGITVGAGDNFDRPNSANLGPNWVIQAGAVGINNNTGVFDPALVSIAILNTTNPGDVILQSDFINVSTPAARVGLVARYSGAAEFSSNFYLGMVWLNPSNNKYEANIFLKRNGMAYQQLGPTKDLTGFFTGAGPLRFEVVGNQLKLFVNNQLQLVAYDAAISGPGGVGIRGQAASLDNFSALTVATQITTLPFVEHFTNAANGADLERVWTEKAGAFSIQSNTAAATTVVANASLATLNTAPVADTIVTADVVAPSGPYSYAGLVARATGTNEADSSFYLGVVDNSGGTFMAYLFRKSAGPGFTGFVQLASANVTALFTAPGTKTLRFEVLGSELKLYANNTLMTVAYDSVLSGPGAVGIRGQNATWDEFNAQAAPSAATSTPFTDNFDTPTNRPDLDRVWTERLGAFSTQNNNAAAAVPSVSLATVNTTTALASPVVSANINVTTPGSHAGLVARYAGPGENNFYVGLVFNNGGAYQAYIFLKQGGGYTQLAVQNLPGFAGTGALRFEVAGVSLKLFVDNVQKAAATDGTLATGFVGIRAFGAALDDFNVQ